MTGTSALYQEIILDHNRAPRNFRRLEDADRSAEGYNPLCGDQFTVFVKLEGDRVVDVSFVGSGCAISKAAGSLMTTLVKGRSRAEAAELMEGFQRLVTGQTEAGRAAMPPQLAAFAGVREFPVRVKCATLPWHALKAALESRSEPVSTE
ncbi:MAG TPA: SUF system NifU family Fe-S cluster assembly protein [Gemmatimonadales bacterium]|jgi:nitrogen fixation NifU-like protein|nr:SUF system NifU family Fe-S cluster assembly protein [Gemmatimonadales bacterium]